MFCTLESSQNPIILLKSVPGFCDTDLQDFEWNKSLLLLSLDKSLYLKISACDSESGSCESFKGFDNFEELAIVNFSIASSLPILTNSRFMFSEKKSVKQILALGPLRAADKVFGRDLVLTLLDFRYIT